MYRQQFEASLSSSHSATVTSLNMRQTMTGPARSGTAVDLNWTLSRFLSTMILTEWKFIGEVRRLVSIQLSHHYCDAFQE